jgi:hypothetical protein
MTDENEGRPTMDEPPKTWRQPTKGEAMGEGDELPKR